MIHPSHWIKKLYWDFNGNLGQYRNIETVRPEVKHLEIIRSEYTIIVSLSSSWQHLSSSYSIYFDDFFLFVIVKSPFRLTFPHCPAIIFNNKTNTKEKRERERGRWGSRKMDLVAKGDDLEKKAEKKLNGWGIFGSKYEDAADLFDKAANNFKLAKSCILSIPLFSLFTK